MFTLTEEQMEIKKAAHEFASKEFKPELGREYDLKAEFPWELYRKAAKLGFIGINIPTEYGGQGLGVLETCLVCEEFFRADSTLGLIIWGPECPGILVRHGSEDQKEKFLPKLCRGEAVNSLALTEPMHGSDAGVVGLNTTAVKDGDYWVINGTKTFITNAPIADFIMVVCQTETKISPPYRGLSIIIVEKGTPGLDIQRLHPKMGQRALPTGEVAFADVRVPKENLIGEENKGFYYVMEDFNTTRTMVAACCVGIAQGALERALKYSTERTQFGRRIADFQAIQFKIAEMATKIEAARLLTYKAAYLVDKGDRDATKFASMAKSYAAKVAQEVTNEALQIYGGYGYVDSDMERYYRDARIWDIVEGTGEIQRYIIARELYREIGYKIAIT